MPFTHTLIFTSAHAPWKDEGDTSVAERREQWARAVVSNLQPAVSLCLVTWLLFQEAGKLQLDPPSVAVVSHIQAVQAVFWAAAAGHSDTWELELWLS